MTGPLVFRRPPTVARTGTVIHVSFLALPLLLALQCGIELNGILSLTSRVLGLVTLVFVPGHAFLWAVGRSPLSTESGAVAGPGDWPLLVTVSLAMDVLVGTLLVVTPIGLSACSLWLWLAGLNLLAIGATRLPR